MKPSGWIRSTSEPIPVPSNLATSKINKSYSLYESQSHTRSKSTKSKLKNLAYTLSRPFRSLMKGHIEKSIGTRNSMDAIKNVNSRPTPNSKTGADSTSTPETSKAISTSPSPPNYEVVGGQGGHRSPTLIEKFWG
jgi:hypothetical protein